MSVGAFLLGFSLILGGLTTAASSHQTKSIAIDPGYPGDIGPIADWGADLINDLRGKKKKANQAMMAVGGSAGPLESPSASVFTDAVDGIDEIVTRILDPNQYPSLTPADAGEVDTTVTPVTLPEYADAVLQLAQEALTEAENGEPIDDDYIGTRLKTVQALLTEYRRLAGVN